MKAPAKHKVFISHHHENDAWAKDQLIAWNSNDRLFTDRSVDTNDIRDGLSSEQIRVEIRDHYLRDSTVTILLVGTQTKRRKHIDWEIHSSMYDGLINKRSGILVIHLPAAGPTPVVAPHGDAEKRAIYPWLNWRGMPDRAELEYMYPYLPDRIIDNLIRENVKISVTRWNDLFGRGYNLFLAEHDAYNFKLLIDLAYRGRKSCKYDFSRPLRRSNS